ncbi:MAG: ADP-ribosylglycohydrolase family protein [Aggregatilineales bacterium]
MNISSDPQDRLQRARVALEGLSVADALGGFFEFGNPAVVLNYVHQKKLPSGEWHFTDDTNMALSIYEILRKHGEITQEALAQSFADHYEPTRGYGLGARNLLNSVKKGEDWREVTQQMFGGTGSYGNGGAMRVSPLGAYFADDLDALMENARKSAEITHSHPEGIAGAQAVALMTAFAYRLSGEFPTRQKLIEQVLPFLPEGEVKAGCVKAHELANGTSLEVAVATLGNGSRVSAQDTVPFVLWSAGENLRDYQLAFWNTAQAGGDADTTCAMVGGIVATFNGRESIPDEWLSHREPLPAWALDG